MIIGVLSDTHRDLHSVERAFKLFQEKGATVVFHLGDINQDVTGKDREYNMEVVTVSGNMDFEPWSAREVVYEGEGVRFLLTHGNYHDVRATKRHLQEKARELGCSAALFGHTHIPYNNREKGILIFNPGSTAFPREGSKKSAGIIWVDERGVTAEVFFL